MKSQRAMEKRRAELEEAANELLGSKPIEGKQ